MPYSFTKIERDKSNVITLLILFLVVIYFVFLYILTVVLRMLFYEWFFIGSPVGGGAPILVEYRIQFLTVPELFFVLGFAVLIALFHWSVATKDLVPQILHVLKAKPLDLTNPSHQQLQNILDELSAATGGEPFKGYVIASMSVNAFSAADFDYTPVLGVTEGLLQRFKRPQIEAVLAHEAAHILKGDSLDAVMMLSLFNLPAEALRDTLSGMEMEDRFIYSARLPFPGIFLLAVLYAMSFLTKTVGQLLNIFISRQREFRADAIAVRLCRDPVSLAEALYLISYHWRGAGLPGEGLSPLFIVRPCYNEFKEGEGLWASLFSTHPPMRERLNILLDMAHTSFEALEESVWGNYKKMRDWLLDQKGREGKWLVRHEGEWAGPFTQEEMRALDWICPGTLVKRIGEAVILSAEQDEGLKQIFETNRQRFQEKIYCPKCYLILNPLLYEDLVILKCRQCEGILAEGRAVLGILHKREMAFGEEIARLAQIVREGKVVMKGTGERELYTDYGLACPQCRNYQNKMARKFYSSQYPVEIDECPTCRRVWFDKNELEILQFLVEGSQAKTQE